MISKDDKIKQYLCSLILEYWEDKGGAPKEPRRILLGWISHIMALEHRRILTGILSDLDFIYKADFMDANVFADFLYKDLFHSIPFRLMCAELGCGDGGR